MTVNISKTTLYKKLGITSCSEILVLNQPQKYTNFFAEFPSNVIINEAEVDRDIMFIHIFVRTRKELDLFYKTAKDNLAKDGFLWVSWPKKTSEIKTELDKFTIMKYGLDNGLVDTKVVSIDQSSLCKRRI